MLHLCNKLETCANGHRISLSSETDLAGWRENARGLLQNGVAPDEVVWTVEGRIDSGELDLLPPAPSLSENRCQPPVKIRIAKDLLSLINTALLHKNEDRFALAYRVLYRAQSIPGLHRNPADVDVKMLNQYAKAIRRDIHKMHAFVRFRKIGDKAEREQFVAWFEPDHHIVEAVAPFFRNRFTGMDWLIVTPEASIAWDGKKLSTGPGGSKKNVPQEDVVEAEWRTYYANIFNPARVKINAMKSEMPMKYWKNLPEAELIPSLVERSSARVTSMIERPDETLLIDKLEDIAAYEEPQSLEALYTLLEQQTNVPSENFAQKFIPGIGPAPADIMFIGEQPGDQEDLAGKPFVGPAGQLLDRALAQAGIDRQKVFLTNAVKRFKYLPRGKRRIHQTPNAGEIDYYRWWVEQEQRLVQPKLTIALGATAARSLIGKPVKIAQFRGTILPENNDRASMITVHPSYLLRIPDEQGRKVEFEKFVRDLEMVKGFMEGR